MAWLHFSPNIKFALINCKEKKRKIGIVLSQFLRWDKRNHQKVACSTY